MKQLATVAVNSEVEVNGKKLKVTEHKIVVRGDEENYSADAVKFKPIDSRNKLIAWSTDGRQVLNESVLFDGIKKDQRIPDKKGGNACGRVFPAWEGVKSFDKDRQTVEKKKAGWYGFLFGEVTFPGKPPVLAVYRITGTQCMDWGKVEKMLGKRHEWPNTLLEIKAVGRAGKEHLATAEYRIAQSGLEIQGIEGYKDEIESYIKRHNDVIMGDDDTEYLPEIKAGAADLDDKIPF